MGPERRQHNYWAVATVPGALALAAMLWAASPWPHAQPAWLLRLTAPDRAELLWLFLLSFLTASGLYAWSRRGRTRALALGLTVLLALISFVLGLVAYWPCASGTAAVFTPFSWVLALFVGSVEQPWEQTVRAGGQCPVEMPLALQLARMTALGATYTSILGIMLALSRRRLDSLIARYARRVVVVIGLDADTSPLLRSLAAGLDRGTRLVVVDASGEPTIAAQSRSLGAQLLLMNVSQSDTLREVLARRSRLVARDVYILGANAADTVHDVRLVERAMADYQPEPGAIARLIVRIDDPWAAQTWRRDHVGHAPWLADAVSLYEETARYVVDQIGRGACRHLILAGRSPLSLAILAELAQRRRERRMLSGAAQALPMTADSPAIVLVGQQGNELLADHRDLQRRFGNENELPQVDIVSRPPTATLISALCDERPGSVVVLAAKPDGEVSGEGTHLASLRPALPILDWWSAAAGFPETPLIGQLYPFGLTLVNRSGAPPLDNWTRLAKLLHEQYRLSAETDDRPSRRSWDEGLPAFYRTSNVRQLACLIAAAKDLGRSWSEATPDELVLGDIWTDAEVEHLAAAEHASWVRFYKAHGWRLSTQRDEHRRRHDLLKDWVALPAEVRAANRENVRRALALLATLGYRAGTGGWLHYRRIGEVTARQIDSARTWRTQAGSTLVAQAGDWMLAGSEGDSWSVEDTIFRRTYDHVDGARYRRSGTVRARRARPGEVVHTLEGAARAEQGDWVVQGLAGESWVVPDLHFIEAYELLSAGGQRSTGG